MSDKDRPHWIERGEQARTPGESRQRRSTAMIAFGVIALIWGAIAFSNGSTLGLLLALLGIGLLVGGLVIR